MNGREIRSFGMFFLFFALAGTAGAAEYYVSPSGNDKNPGSRKAPFATITRAAAAAKGGDTVNITPGIYREGIILRRSGTPEAPIVFKGTRGKNGEYLSVIEAPGKRLDKWLPAPEAGPEIWKAAVQKRPDLVMMDGSMITYVNRRTMEVAPWKKAPPPLIDGPMLLDKYGPDTKRLPGMDHLRLPLETRVKHKLFRGRQELFWPVIGNVLSGWRDGYLYLRLADKSKPQDHRFTISYGNVFSLISVSNVKFSDLHVRGSRQQFVLTGNSSGITIENSLLMHGQGRIFIARSVKGTTVRNCILTAGFIRNDLFQLRSDNDMRGGVLYRVFKHIIGTGTSADAGITDYGRGTRILDNIFLKGLIAIDSYGQETEAARNVIREMSSVGLCTGPRSRGRYHRNLYMNCGIPIRIHALRHERAQREEFHYGNISIQGHNAGGHVYVHCTSHLTRADGINFEPFINRWGRKRYRYKKNPPDPVDAGKIYFYHNTFWGGDNRYIAVDFENLPRRFRMALPFFVINNIFKDSQRQSTKDHELTGPNLFYVFPGDKPFKRSDPLVPKVNKVLSAGETAGIWNRKDIPGLVDLSLAPRSPALETGIDLSRPFTAQGKEYKAFPGYKPGYFKGKAPAAGALQQGESFDKFAAMHRRAEEAVKLVNSFNNSR